MWNIFLDVILFCLGAIGISLTLFIVVVVIDTMIKQIKKK